MDELLNTILVSILNKNTWNNYRDVLNPDLFTNNAVRTLYECVAELHEQTESDLTLHVLRLDVQSRYKSSDRRDELLQLVDSMEDMEMPEPELLEHYVRRFVEREIAYKVAWYISNKADSDDFNVNYVADMFERAVETGSLIDAQVSSIQDIPIGTSDDRISVSSLGLSDELDGVLRGGVGAGELLVLLAPPARGKTSFLWEMTTNAARQGFNSLGVTLEIKESMCFRRIYQSLTKMTSDELVTARSAIRSEVANLPGQLWVKDWSYRGITTDDIAALVKRMNKNGQRVDFLMIDYLELVRPTTYNRNSERHNYARVVQDIRALAVELQIPIVTAWQVNRAGSDNWLLSERDISECWDVVKIADIILGLNQTRADKDEKLMRVNVIKQREGTTRPQVALYCDLERMDIRAAGSNEDEDPKAV
jgi:replicative DNA helicase